MHIFGKLHAFVFVYIAVMIKKNANYIRKK